MSAPLIYRFGPFEFDGNSLELQRGGSRVPLEPQPARLLALLLQRKDAVVSREEIRQHLWRDGSFVDFSRGVRYAVGHLRRALGETAARPVFLHTLSRRGYRFSPGGEAAAPTLTHPADHSRETVHIRRPGAPAIAAGVAAGLLPGTAYAHLLRPWLADGAWLGPGCLADAYSILRGMF